MKIWAIDTETTGLNPYKGDRPFLFLAYDGENYIASRDKESIKNICEDENCIKLFHNAKFDIKMLGFVDIEVKGIVYDTMIASFLLDENRLSHGLKPLARDILKETTNEETAIENWFKENKILKNNRKYDQLPDEILIEYGKKDVEYTYKLWKIFEPKLYAENLWKLFENECAILRILVDIENRGVLIDRKSTIELKEFLEKRMKEIEESIKNMYGPTFNHQSSKQLGEILVRDGIEVSRTEKGNIQTDEKSLATYEHPLCKLIVEYRKKQKLHTTYCEGFLEAMDENDVIHCEYRQIGTVTGRFSSANPNLQNIPRPDEKKSDEAKMIRSLFKVRPNYTNYYFDYAQIEYRLVTEYAQDEHLIEQINKGIDLHTLQAQRIFKTDEVSKYQRTVAKTVNFGILYGAGVSTLAGMLNISKQEAQDIFDNFLSANPNLQKLRQNVNSVIYKRGYIYNKFGRRRRLKPSESYKALNSLCQGLAADIVKIAMVRINKLLKGTNSHMLMNVHDEVCIEIYNGEEYLVNKIKEAMENFNDLFNVKILTDFGKSNTNWFDKK